MKDIPENPSIGVVGLGLMGSSITTALVVSGYPVIALAPVTQDLEKAPDYLRKQLHHAQTLNLLNYPVDHYIRRINITEDYSELKKCSLVLECVTEDRDIKSSVYQRIESNISVEAMIGTNTSAIPISALQQYLQHPERFLGIHWAEPAYATRFLEITSGEQTDPKKAQLLFEWAHDWNKEPTLLKKDIRGFITNRLMYALYREALHLNEQGVGSLEDLDKAFRYDAGSWVGLMGIFQRMDFVGLDKSYDALKHLLPQLNNSSEVPQIMKKIVEDKARGIHNQDGLYSYTKKEAHQWEEAFSRFNRDMYFLTDKYIEKKEPVS